MKKTLLSAFIALDLLALNVLVGILVYNKLNEPTMALEDIQNTREFSTEVNDKSTCSDACVSYIDEKIAKITPTVEREVVEREVVVTQAPVQNFIDTKKTKSVSYVPIPGSGNTTETSWTDIEGSDFYLSKVDYPGITEVYFEANMKLLNGNGSGYLRLYDVTNARAVDGSEIETSSQASEFVGSGPITLWEGYNHYKVQARSLTADTTYFESGRLKIISEN